MYIIYFFLLELRFYSKSVVDKKIEIIAVLISPSLHIGFDLKDDLSRFQIITKVPYLSLADRWIDEKRKRNEQWYTWQTALKLVQGYGRSIRSKEDWAITYVVDAAFGHFVFRNRDILPDWFRAAIRRTSS
jgi:ATP-dependent DNA helicase DinG